MKLRITSDGTFEGTKVIDSETGKELEDVYSVEWYVSKHHSLATISIRTNESLDGQITELKFIDVVGEIKESKHESKNRK